jgi:C1A family cysteine protease
MARKTKTQNAAPHYPKVYGWKPDLPDARDQVFKAPRATAKALPASVDLRLQLSPVRDQGALGSCTGFACAGMLEYYALKAKRSTIYSPLFAYYYERMIEDTIAQDAGAMIRTAAKVALNIGVADEKQWPYLPAKFRNRPPAAAATNAIDYRVSAYQRVSGLQALKQALALGQPVMFGFAVYDSFESDEVAKTGRMPMPATGERMLGGHAVLAVGYNDSDSTIDVPVDHIIVRNSWGKDWGLKGYFAMPYAYVTNSNLSDDFWTLTP